LTLSAAIAGQRTATPDAGDGQQSPAPASPATSPEQLLWDLVEAAAALSVSTRTLERMAGNGELPTGAVVRLGRRRLFSVPVLREWVRQGCPAPVRIRNGRRGK
jgi:excisionase family DNA binding protein